MSGSDSTRPGVRALVAAARAAQAHAIATFSGFRVGAALQASDGAIVAGCNLENATLGLTMCAERVAIFRALSDGFRIFNRIAIVAETEQPTPPCGACRQVLWEFAGDIEVVLVARSGEIRVYGLKTLLPLPFDGRLLNHATRAPDR